MKTEIVTKPAYHPVTLAQVKLHLRITSSAEDTLLTGIIIPAAHRDAAAQLGRSIMLTSWQGVMDCFPRGRLLDLPWPKLQSVTSVGYRDATGVLQTLNPALYRVDLVQSRIYLKPDASWPEVEGTSGCVTAAWKSGFDATATGDAVADEAAQQAAVPENVKSWILLRCGSLYEFRELLLAGTPATEIPLACGLLNADREWAI